MSKTATRVRDVSRKFNGVAILYRLNPPLEGHEHVVVASGVCALLTGPETYIFGADERGNVVDWCELRGSTRGGVDCDAAIRLAGYEIIKAAP